MEINDTEAAVPQRTAAETRQQLLESLVADDNEGGQEVHESLEDATEGDSTVVGETKDGEGDDDDLFDLSDLDEEDDNASDDDEDGEDTLDGDGIPELDPALHSETNLKRWREQWKGVTKRQRQLDGKEQELRKGFESYNTLINWAQAFQDESTVRGALTKLHKELAQLHGSTVEDLLGTKPQARDDEDDYYEDTSVEAITKKVRAELEEKYERDMAALKADVQEYKSDREQIRQTTELEKRIAKETPNISKKIGSTYRVNITEDQVRKAVQARPELAGNLEEAVLVHFRPQLEKALQKNASRSRAKIAPMHDSATSTGKVIKKPGDVSIADFM